MKTFHWKILILVLLTSISLISCAPATVAVRTRPSAPVYIRPNAPSRTHIWVGESYKWRGNRYVYQPGYWATPRKGHTYVQGYWANNRQGAYWVPGYWR